MKKHLLYTLIYICISAILSSCDGVVVSDNGNLDGMWHLVQIDSLKNDNPFVSVDYTDKGIYWSVQYKLLLLKNVKSDEKYCIMRFNHADGKLTVNDPYYLQERPIPDIKIEDATVLSPFGINGFEDTFDVETLNRKKMTLRSSLLRLYFMKF